MKEDCGNRLYPLCQGCCRLVSKVNDTMRRAEERTTGGILEERKASVIAKMLPPHNIPLERLSQAVRIYLHQKGKGRPVTFHRAAERSCGYVIDACGDKHLDAYTKADANAFRDALIARGLNGSSITRVFGTVRAVTNFAASEQGLSITNPFAGVYYDRTAGVSDRLPIPADALAAIGNSVGDRDLPCIPTVSPTRTITTNKKEQADVSSSEYRSGAAHACA